MSSWCRQVNWENCEITWVNCAVLFVKDDWKGQFWGLRYCLSQLRSLLSFPSGMTSHSKIARFNWECTGRLSVVPNCLDWKVILRTEFYYENAVLLNVINCFNKTKYFYLDLSPLCWIRKIVPPLAPKFRGDTWRCFWWTRSLQIWPQAASDSLVAEMDTPAVDCYPYIGLCTVYSFDPGLPYSQ
jgi:hypothetical protein